MVLKYGIEFDGAEIEKNINKITNQIFKLLPSREEGGDWMTPLESLIIEVAGMAELLKDHCDLFSLLCKMESLLNLTKEEDFLNYRKTIFECLGLMNGIKICL